MKGLLVSVLLIAIAAVSVADVPLAPPADEPGAACACGENCPCRVRLEAQLAYQDDRIATLNKRLGQWRDFGRKYEVFQARYDAWKRGPSRVESPGTRARDAAPPYYGPVPVRSLCPGGSCPPFIPRGFGIFR